MPRNLPGSLPKSPTRYSASHMDKVFIKLKNNRKRREEETTSANIINLTNNRLDGGLSPFRLVKDTNIPAIPNSRYITWVFFGAISRLTGNNHILNIGDNIDNGHETIRIMVLSSGLFRMYLKPTGPYAGQNITATTQMSVVLNEPIFMVMSVDIFARTGVCQINGISRPLDFLGNGAPFDNLSWNENFWCFGCRSSAFNESGNLSYFAFTGIIDEYFDVITPPTYHYFWNVLTQLPRYPGPDGSLMFGKPARLWVSGSVSELTNGKGNNQLNFFDNVLSPSQLVSDGIIEL